MASVVVDDAVVGVVAVVVGPLGVGAVTVVVTVVLGVTLSTKQSPPVVSFFDLGKHLKKW